MVSFRGHRPSSALRAEYDGTADRSPAPSSPGPTAAHGAGERRPLDPYVDLLLRSAAKGHLVDCDSYLKQLASHRVPISKRLQKKIDCALDQAINIARAEHVGAVPKRDVA